MNQAKARATDPSTSHEAATSVNLTENQRAVMAVMRMFDTPVHDEYLVTYYDAYYKRLGLPQQSESGIRSRRKELVDQGLLVEHDKQKMSTGRMGRTWKVA